MVAGERERGISRRWIILPPATSDAARNMGIPLLWATLLQNRNVTSGALSQSFLKPPPLSDPFLLPGMHAAVARVTQAVQKGEKIAVYGDFDADGVTACALLYSALARLGAQVVAYLPHRSREGHGLNLDAIASLKAQGVSLIITVDCGITASTEVAAARDMGVETIITDHHVADAETPPAVAMVTTSGLAPDSPLQFLAGAGLSFKLAHALFLNAHQQFPDDLLGLAAIGTVADLTPLIGENRTLVTEGLQALNRSTAPGILALCASAGVRPGGIDARSMAFSLVPRINAAGRMDSADASFNLLTAKTLEQARPWADELDKLNRQRQQLTAELWVIALASATEQSHTQRLLYVASERFVPGVNGLLASRLVEEFHRPVVVAALGTELAWASARSVPEFNVAAAFQRHASYLVRFGGHAGAAGFTVERAKLPAFLAALRETAEPDLSNLDPTPALRIDAEVGLRFLLGETFEFLERMAPFGAGNPQPIFLTRGASVVDKRRLGNAGQHMMLKLRSEGALWTAMAFAQRGGTEQYAAVPLASRIDIAYTIERDTYDARGAPRLILLDHKQNE